MSDFFNSKIKDLQTEKALADWNFPKLDEVSRYMLKSKARTSRITMIIAASVGILNFPFIIGFYLMYAIYGDILTITAFLQHIYTQNLQINLFDVIKVIIMCTIENVFFRFVLGFVCAISFISYWKKKNQ